MSHHLSTLLRRHRPICAFCTFALRPTSQPRRVPLAAAPPPLYQHLRHRRVHSVGVSVEQRRSAGTHLESSPVTMNPHGAEGRGKPFERLPATAAPRSYRLALRPDLGRFGFDGDVKVEIEVLKQTTELVLNSMELEIKSATLLNSNTPAKVNYSTEDETVTLAFSNPISPGVYTLHVIYTGILNDKMKGFYRSRYKNQNGDEKYLAVTQFEPTDARRCFPCWDEPALKATFDISLTVPKDLVALSNMPVKKETVEGELVRYDFETTPIMSTYLVACVVGEYDYVEAKSADGVLVRVYTAKGKKEQGRFALEVGSKVLPYYKDYFNIAYPLPKIDLIAIPDFTAGAMENWGLVTYRENCLLVDPKNSSAITKQWIALVVGHELAHQWFGNLVTMEWWTHLWLNEGYASFVEYLCVDHIFPEYDIWTQFLTDTYMKGMELDCLKNSHPIEVPVGHPSEIDEIFDDISYNKGAAIIRMLHNYIGDQDFRKGMNLYLTRHQYKNTFTEDLWSALEEASKKPVGAIMSTWTKQMGFPVIKVTSKYENNRVVLTLKQTKYTADGSDPTGDFHWLIPISIVTSKQSTVSIVLKEKSEDVVLEGVGPDDWIKLNPGTVGFYRVQYEGKLLEKFIPAIKDKSLAPLDRLGILDDLFAMVKAGHASTVEVLKLLSAYEDETNYTVWSSICNTMGKLNALLAYTDCFDKYRTYQAKLLRKVYHRLGWNPHPNEGHLDTLLRSLVLSRLAWLDDEQHVAEATKRFTAHTNSSQTLPADLRSACYKTVLRANGNDIYGTLVKMYKEADLYEEKDRIGSSLGAAKEAEVLSKTLKFAISDEVRSQDTVFIVIAVTMSRLGRELAWEFFRDNWNLFSDRYKGYMMTRLIKYVCENFANEEAAIEVEEYFKVHDTGAARSVQQAVETIRLNAEWLKRDTDAIRNYLNANV